MDELRALQSLGLELPGPAYLFGSILFGLLGLMAFRQGRRHERKTTMWIGVALMVYPYAVSSTWLLYAIGVALCFWIYLDGR